MTATTAVISVIWPLPVFGRWLAILITASALVMTFKESKAHLDTRQMIFVTLALLLVDQLYLYSANIVSFSGLWSLVLSTLHYPLLMLLFMLLARKLTCENQPSKTLLD